MSMPPVLPLMVDGTLPPVPVLLRWLAAVAGQGIHHVHLDRLPPGNGALPDLLADAGIERLSLLHPPFPPPFQWQGWSGGQILVGSGDHAAVVALHHGELPWWARSGSIAHDLRATLVHARLDDARAVVEATAPGAAWSHVLANLAEASGSHPQHTPDTASGSIGDLGAWNPLALARRTVVALPIPGGATPPGLRDQRGVRYPVQVVVAPGGRELLTSVGLGALEAVRFEPCDKLVPGCHWEVTSAVIDNGRVRAELDALGQIVRLCCDGRFVDWAGPGLQPFIGDQPLSAPCTITVTESGPIRGRIVVTRSDAHRTLRLTYSVHAHEPELHLSVEWDGDAELRLSCPTMVPLSPLEVGGDLSSWTVPQHARADGDAMAAIAGLRWARLREADQRGLAVFGLQPMRVSANAGQLSLHIAHTGNFALCDSAWPATAPAIAPLALALATPVAVATSVAVPQVRVLGDGVVPEWIARPTGWAGELLLCQPHAQRERCTIYVSANEAVRVRGHGDLTALRRTPDGDGFEVDLTAGDVATIRWR